MVLKPPVVCMQEPELMILLEEVAALGQLMQAAARAVVGSGRDFPPMRGLWQSSSTPAGGVRHSRVATAPTSRQTTVGMTIHTDMMIMH